MNERNVAALAAALTAIGWWWRMDADEIAYGLAACGVLVPSALTDNQALGLGCGCEIYYDAVHDAGVAASLRTYLERCARGEEAGTN